jgi:hypothetical protein
MCSFQNAALVLHAKLTVVAIQNERTLYGVGLAFAFLLRFAFMFMFACSLAFMLPCTFAFAFAGLAAGLGEATTVALVFALFVF